MADQAKTTPLVVGATLAEIPILIELMAEFYAESAYSLDNKSATQSFRTLLTDPSRGAAWIAFDGDMPVGHTVLTLRHSMEFGGTDGFIDDLFVKPTHRRRGFATALLDALYGECERRRIRAVHVETSVENPAAVAVYTRFGMLDRKRLLLTRKLAD